MIASSSVPAAPAGCGAADSRDAPNTTPTSLDDIGPIPLGSPAYPARLTVLIFAKGDNRPCAVSGEGPRDRAGPGRHPGNDLDNLPQAGLAGMRPRTGAPARRWRSAPPR